MKKIFLICFVVPFLFSQGFAKTVVHQSGGSVSPICTSDGKICMLGNYTLRTNGSEPIRVENGIMCTPDGRICTNGYQTLRSSKALR